jgi:hypothetical protein
MSKITSTNFAAQLLSVSTAFGTIRDNIQSLLEFSMVQASKDNYTYINMIVQNAGKLKGISMDGIKTYIEKHCDVKLESEAGVRKFANKQTEGFVFVAPKATWWEDNDKGGLKVVDLDRAVQSLINSLTGVVDGKKDLKEGHSIDEVKKVLAGLKKLAPKKVEVEPSF